MRISALFALGLLLLLTGRLSAQDKAERVPIGLAEAVKHAVEHNPALAQTGAELAMAEDSLLASRGLDDLVLDASTTWLETRHQLVSGAPVQQPAFDDLQAFASLTQPLPTGGRLGFRVGGEYSRTEYATDLGTDVQHSIAEAVAPSLQLFFQHPLLRGIGRKVARAPRLRASVQRDASALLRENTAAALLRDVANAYWDLYYAVRELAIRRGAAESAREQLRRVRAQIEVGKQPPSASAEIEVAIALRDDAVLLAEQSWTERSIELTRLMGQSAVTARWHVATDVPAQEPPVPEPGELLPEVIARNPQLAYARTQGRAAQLEVAVGENGMLPQLDFTASGGTVGNASAADTAFAQLVQPGSYQVTAGLLFQLPVQNRAARGARELALHGLQRARFAEADTYNQLVASLTRLCAAARSGGQRAAVLSRSIEIAALDLDAERARFEVGRSTNFDVLRRQDEVAQVQLGQARAQVDQVKALAALDALTGRNLDRFGVHVR